MICFPNCKINIGLNILQKREDGYHDIETIFYPLKLQDALEIGVSEETNLILYGKDILGTQDENIVLKAFYLLKKDFNQIRNISISLLKNIPTGAGLGGGSSDATSMLILLNNYFDLKISHEKMMEYALILGSDCPFFIKNVPSLAQGRGEILTAIDLDVNSYTFVLIKPLIHISTKWAFENIKPTPNKTSLKEFIQMPIHTWKNNIKNDFETPIVNHYPALKYIKNELYNLGALYSAMSGSGSVFYGIFENKISDKILKNTFPNFETYIC